MIEFDPKKDAENVAKHGVSLTEYARFEHDFSVCFEIHHVEGEEREVWAGPVGGHVHVAVIALRDETVRVISLRRAKSHEVREWRREIENG